MSALAARSPHPHTSAGIRESRRRRGTRFLSVVGVTALSVLAYTLIRPPAAHAADSDLTYSSNGDGSVVAIFDDANGVSIQMDLAALDQEQDSRDGISRASDADVAAAYSSMKTTTQQITGWNLDTDLSKVNTEIQRFHDTINKIDMSGSRFGDADRRLQASTRQVWNSTTDIGVCRGRCLGTPLGTTIARTIVLGAVATTAGLALSATGVVGLPASGIMLGIVVAVNLISLATQIYDRMRANADARQSAVLQQQANYAMVRMMALGQTALQQAFHQAGSTMAAIDTQAENAATSYSFAAGQATDEAFIDQMDLILDRV